MAELKVKTTVTPLEDGRFHIAYVDGTTQFIGVSAKRALLKALAREAGAKKVIMNPRPGVSMRPVDGGPLIIKNGAKYLVIPLEDE